MMEAEAGAGDASGFGESLLAGGQYVVEGKTRNHDEEMIKLPGVG